MARSSLYCCSKGEVPSNSTTEVPTNQTATPEPEDVAIPTDRGGFVEQTETQPLTTAHPSKEIGIAITAVSAVFTFSTVVVFSCAVGYVSYVNRHKCVTCWNCLLPYLCIAKRNTSTPLLEEGKTVSLPAYQCLLFSEFHVLIVFTDQAQRQETKRQLVWTQRYSQTVGTYRDNLQHPHDFKKVMCSNYSG